MTRLLGLPQEVLRNETPLFSHFPHRAGVLRDEGIRRQQSDALNPRLRNQEAVKRVLVKHRQTVHGDGMFTADR